MENILFAFLLLAAWFWFDSISARERAISSSRELARRCGLQLLDETVACRRLRFGRNSRGRLQLMRTYEFEVSASGSERLSCQLVLLGADLQSWHIPPYLQPLH